MEEITEEPNLESENISERTPFWQNLKIPIVVALVVVGLVATISGWWVWRNQLLDRILVSKLCEEDSDCTFTQCCGCASKCRKICSERPFAIPCQCDNNQCVGKIESQVTITTDKTEYEQGETMRITLKNGLDRPIFGHFDYCGGDPFWGLEKFADGEWKRLDFSLPSLYSGKENCDVVLCERIEPAELKTASEIKDQWHLTNICEWPEKSVGVPKTEPKPIAEGSYRIFFTYGLGREGFALLKAKTIYSNEFRIKEIVQLQEISCQSELAKRQAQHLDLSCEEFNILTASVREYLYKKYLFTRQTDFGIRYEKVTTDKGIDPRHRFIDAFANFRTPPVVIRVDFHEGSFRIISEETINSSEE